MLKQQIRIDWHLQNKFNDYAVYLECGHIVWRRNFFGCKSWCEQCACAIQTQLAFIPTKFFNWVDMMICPNCGLNWFNVVGTDNYGGFYHQCKGCGHRHANDELERREQLTCFPKEPTEAENEAYYILIGRTHNQYLPDLVSLPGETLLEIIEELEMSQAELAKRMGRPKKTINEIIKGKAAITPQTAMQLERVLGIPADFWNNRERFYRQYLARMEEND